MQNSVDLTIITPCYNEEASVLLCAERVKEIMNRQLSEVSYEHIFIDNSSTDRTVEVLREIAAVDKNVKVLVNSRNVGPFRNIYAAMQRASGRAVIPMLPADLQDPPEKIPALYNEFKKGFLVVFGERTSREESFFMRGLRSIYYRTIRSMASINIPINSGEFMIIDKRINDEICRTSDHYPYIRGLVAASADKTSSIGYVWKKRVSGSSKSKFLSLLDQGLNGFISTSRVPARITLIFGFLVSILAFLAAITVTIATLLGILEGPQGIPILTVSIFFFAGLQIFFLGLIGEYVLGIHSQVRPLPREFTIESINFD